MKFLGKWFPLLSFKGSGDYWRKRYRYGGDSCAGSGGQSARYKADALNRFVAERRIGSIIEFGCGDGRQLELARYPQYLGVDISPEAVALCRGKFRADASKAFMLLDEFQARRAELTLSLDVIFHLVEDEVYRDYLERLFASTTRYVAIYSTVTESSRKTLPHVRHRCVAEDIARWFPGFARLHDDEASLPVPDGDWDNGARFLFYARS